MGAEFLVRPQCMTAEELREALLEGMKALTPSVFKPYFDGAPPSLGSALQPVTKFISLEF